MNNNEKEIKEQETKIEQKNPNEEQTTKSTSITSNESKPRKWLLVLLIIVSLVIVGFLAYQTINGILKRKANSNQKTWGIFNILQKNSEFEEKVKDIIDQNQEQIDETNNQIKEEENRQKINSFNRKFEQHMGTQYNVVLGWLLDDVILNNKKSNEHTITVVFKTTTTTDPEMIKNLKKQFVSNHQYEVSIDYDEIGYVNKITIEE